MPKRLTKQSRACTDLIIPSYYCYYLVGSDWKMYRYSDQIL